MNIQARKYNLIQFLIELNDEKILSKIENAVLGEKKTKVKKNFKILTKEEIQSRAEKSNEDYLAGRFKTQEQLEKETANW